LAAGVAWIVVVVLIRAGIGGGLQLLPFAGAWTAMMAAMMLPSVAPVAALYSRSVGQSRLRQSVFTVGYFAVWASTGIIAYAVMAAGSSVISPAWARPIAAGAFLLVGVYQLTPLKAKCLDHCRSPLALFLQYASYQGRLRDLKAGSHHGLYCLGCCWALMLLLPVVGMMNLIVVVVLAAFVVVEKNLSRGRGLSRVGAVAAVLLGIAALFTPQLSLGLAPAMT
jgi:predicted metal-binding membrane protein